MERIIRRRRGVVLGDVDLVVQDWVDDCVEQRGDEGVGCEVHLERISGSVSRWR